MVALLKTCVKSFLPTALHQLTPALVREPHARRSGQTADQAARKHDPQTQRGKTLTAREEAILAQAQTAEPSTASMPAAGGYAKTWDELADACSIDRRTLTNFRKRMGAKCPAARADGRHPMADWIRFPAERGVKGRGENNRDISCLDDTTFLRMGVSNLSKCPPVISTISTISAGLPPQ
jgi:hypothetical protein